MPPDGDFCGERIEDPGCRQQCEARLRKAEFLLIASFFCCTRSYSIASVVGAETPSAFFATPPESSYEEALGYLLSAAENRENWIRCAKLIGDVYVKLQQQIEAKEWYGKAMSMPASKNAAEADAQVEAAAKHEKL